MMIDDSSSGYSILIAEDEEHIALALHAIINKAFDCHIINIAEDGQKAWDYLKDHKYDLIVSDWNMPGLTGQQLLDNVRRSSLNKITPFLMLTARADKNSVIQAVQAGANDYISKPYQKDLLTEKIAGLLDLSQKRTDSVDQLSQDNMKNTDDSTRDIVQNVLNRFKEGKVELPVLPHVYNSVNKVMEKEDYSVDEIVKIIETEPAVSAALITISNASFYQGSSSNKTLDQAITRIGLKAARHYIFMIEGRFLFNTNTKSFMRIMTKLWEHSLATSICAREISRHLKMGDMDVIFSMGLLHDIGKLPLVNLLIELSEKRDDITEEIIYSVFEELHTEIGAIMLTQWHFPEEIIDVVKYHHDLAGAKRRTNELLIVHLANMLVRTIGYSFKPGDNIVPEELESAKLLHIDKLSIDTVISNVTKDIDAIKSQLS